MSRPSRASRRLRRVVRPIILLAVAILLTLVPVAHGATTTFTLIGRGWGHGVGMSQYGAEGYARHGKSFRWILTHYYSDTTVAAVSNLNLRVLLLDGASQVTVASGARMSFRDEATGRAVALSPSTRYSVSVASGKYRLRNASSGARIGDYAGPVRISPTTSTIRLYNANANQESGLRYRGWFRILLRAGRLRVVNYVPVESYLRGVVPAEMPASWRAEALKAQACAARSFALSKRTSSGDFDLYATTRSQYYGAVNAEDYRTNSAISATKGLVVKYGGAIIPAYFHSTSGGQTENVENVWGGSGLAWAKGVTDEYDTISPYHTWPNNPIRYTPQALAAKLGAYSSANPSGVKGSLRGLVVTSTGASPRARRITITGSGGTSYITGAQLRDKLRLRSTWAYARAMSITSTTTIVGYGRTVGISGKAVPPGTGNVLTFKARRIGSSTWSTAQIATAADGRFYKTVSPYAGTYYQTALGWYSSPLLLVRVRVIVSLAASNPSVTLGQTIRLGGGVAPGHAGKTVSVKWYTGTAWRTFASPVLNSSSRYSVSFKPGRKGTFYFSTLFPSDSNHVGNVSKVASVIVK